MKHFDDFDEEFSRMRKFAYGWFIFSALLTIALLGGIVFVVFMVFEHFGIL